MDGDVAGLELDRPVDAVLAGITAHGDASGRVTACAIVNGTQGALLSEAFPTHLRYSGFSIVVQIGTLLGAAISPLVSAVLMATTGTAYSVAAYAAAMALISLVAVAALRTSPGRFADPENRMRPTVEASAHPPSEPARGAGA